MVKILVMEDDEAFSEVLTELLVSRNHKVTTCSCATEARSHIEKTRFDLLITDILIYQGNTPVPDGGISLITWLRSGRARHQDDWLEKMPIIAISGAIHQDGMSNILQMSRDLGADVTLGKPTSPLELLTTIDNLCRPSCL